MLSGIDGSNASFLADLNRIQNNISQTTNQISSGVRVSQASDDPAAVGSILEDQNQIDQINQVQTNLALAGTDAQTADGALESASSLMNQLISIAGQGTSLTANGTTNTSLAQEVQQIQQQLVSIANTTVDGRYIFGGDDPTTQPYTYTGNAPEGVVQNNTAANTNVISDASGNTIVPRMTAQQIFDAQTSPGVPAAGNVFNAVYSLSQALLSNNQAGIQAAGASISAAASQVSQANAFYGSTENWIQQATSEASSSLTNLQSALGGLRDTDVAAAATQLTSDQTSLEAALSSHADLSTKSLFSYLG